MKRSLFLFAILTSFVILSCSETINNSSKRNDKWVWWIDKMTRKGSWISLNAKGKAPQNGMYTFFYYNGQVYKKGKLKDGEDVDTTYYYDLKGRLQQAIIYGAHPVKYFFKNGPFKMLYANGKVESIGVVKNHTYGNHWKSYFEDGKLNFVITDKNDSGDCWVTSYYPNGKMKDSTIVLKNVLFTTRRWFEDGQLAESIEFRGGAYNGKGVKYYPNGVVQATALYVDGNINGKHVVNYENGKVHVISFEKNGVLNGPQLMYYRNGHIQMVGSAKNGKSNGELKKFDENGSLIGKYYFKEGVLVHQ